MMYEIYIDGILADVDDGIDVEFTINSNLLNGAEIKGNTSTTIKLPATANNLKLIGHAEKVAGSPYPYVTHNVTVMRNGVQVIKGGNAVLLRTADDGIEMTLIWGVVNSVQKLSDGDETLADFNPTDSIQFNYPAIISPYSGITSLHMFYAQLDTMERANLAEFYTLNMECQGKQWMTQNTDVPPSTLRHYLHPSVPVPYLLELIEARYGVTFAWPQDAEDYIGTLIVPLLTKNPGEATFGDGFIGLLNEPWPTQADTHALHIDDATDITQEQQSHLHDLLVYPSNTADDHYWLSALNEFSGVVRFTLNLYMELQDLNDSRYPLYSTNEEIYIDIEVSNIGEGTSSHQRCTAVTQGRFFYEGTQHGYVFLTAEGQAPIEMAQGDRISIRFTGKRGNTEGDEYGETLHVTDGRIWISDIDAEQVEPGQQFPMAGNLPDIKPVDLLKTLCVLTGCYVKQGENDTITFAPVTDMYDWSDPEDWSGRILSKTDKSVAKGTEYLPSNVAKKTWYKWKHDDKTKGNYDGYIVCNAASAEDERTAFTFPFAASDGNNVPIYTTEADDDNGVARLKVKLGKCEPRILNIVNENSAAVGRFDMAMENIIADRYAELGATLANPVVISEDIRISDIEIAEFDETRPVYLSQHGAHFAVLTLKTKGEGIAEATLLKLVKEA